jgi:hypothetical protein
LEEDGEGEGEEKDAVEKSTCHMADINYIVLRILEYIKIIPTSSARWNAKVKLEFYLQEVQ